jgi:hypothetical protein
VIYLREHDPAEFLAKPVLAPFAALGHASPMQREEALGAAIRLLREVTIRNGGYCYRSRKRWRGFVWTL